MTSYTAIPNGDIDQDSPVTQPLLTLIRDNPIAIAEGSADAPVNRAGWHPYDMVLSGDGNDGEIYDFATDGTVANIVSPDFADGYEYALVIEALTHNSGTQGVTVELYMNQSSSYATIGTTGTFAASVALDGIMGIPFPRLASKAHSITEIKRGAISSATVSLELFSFIATASVADKIRLSVSGGSFNGGKVYMLRRREFVTG